jgi:hypothetical protein
MTPDTSLSGIETAVIVLAAAQALQTALFLALLIGGWVAYARTKASLEREIAALRVLAERAVDTLRDTAAVVSRAAGAVNDTVTEGRDAVQTVASWATPLASAVSSPRAAAAAAVWRGIRWWRRRRDEARHGRAIAAPR